MVIVVSARALNLGFLTPYGITVIIGRSPRIGDLPLRDFVGRAVDKVLIIANLQSSTGYSYPVK